MTEQTMNQQDRKRLASLQSLVANAMLSGGWWTLPQLRVWTGGRHSEAGISAAIRKLRKPPTSWTIERRRVKPGGGLWEYRRMVRPGLAIGQPE